MTNLWSLTSLWKSTHLLNTANMLLLWYSTISFQVTAQSLSSSVCTPFSHYWPLFPTQQADNIVSIFLAGQFHYCRPSMLKWQPIKPEFLSPSLDRDGNTSFRPCFSVTTTSLMMPEFLSYKCFILMLPYHCHLYLLPPMSWMTLPSKSRLIEFGYPFCFRPVFTGPACDFHCFELLQIFSINNSVYPYDILKGQIHSVVFPCI